MKKTWLAGSFWPRMFIFVWKKGTFFCGNGYWKGML
jgi:hypothetical protein